MIQNKNFIYVLITEAVCVRILIIPVTTTMKSLSLSTLLPAGQSGPFALYTLSSLAQEGFSGPCWAGTMLVFVVLRYSLSTYPRPALNSYHPPALALLVLGFQVWAITPDWLWLIDTPLQSTRLWATWGKFCLVFLFCFVFAAPHRGIGTEEFQQGHWHSNWPSTPYSMADFKTG